MLRWDARLCLPQPGREGGGEAAAQVSNKGLGPGKPRWSLSITQSLALLLPALAVGATGVTSAHMCTHTHTPPSALLCLLASSISLEPKPKPALNLSFSLVARDNQIEFEKPQERLMCVWPDSYMANSAGICGHSPPNTEKEDIRRRWGTDLAPNFMS